MFQLKRSNIAARSDQNVEMTRPAGDLEGTWDQVFAAYPGVLTDAAGDPVLVESIFAGDDDWKIVFDFNTPLVRLLLLDLQITFEDGEKQVTVPTGIAMSLIGREPNYDTVPFPPEGQNASVFTLSDFSISVPRNRLKGGSKESCSGPGGGSLQVPSTLSITPPAP